MVTQMNVITHNTYHFKASFSISNISRFTDNSFISRSIFYYYHFYSLVIEKGFFKTPPTSEGSVQRSSSSSLNIRPIASFTPDAARLIKRSHLRHASSITSRRAVTRKNQESNNNGRMITDFISPSAEPELADRRSFGHRPVNFKGSILGQYKKHWDDEEDEEGRLDPWPSG